MEPLGRVRSCMSQIIMLPQPASEESSEFRVLSEFPTVILNLRDTELSFNPYERPCMNILQSGKIHAKTQTS